MNLDLSGKTALISGASKGIGRACAEELAFLGCRVIALARSKEKLLELSQQLELISSKEHRHVVVDVSDRSLLKQIIEKELQQCGPIEILINNTGGPPGGPVVLATEGDFTSAFNNHLQVAALLTQLLLPGMRAKRYGRIINILSTSVKTPLPLLGISNTVRWAVAGWAKTLSQEVGQFGITVNCLLPGATATDRLHELAQQAAKRENKSVEQILEEQASEIPLRRFADAREIAYVAAFLAAPASSYVNGIALAVDGGRTACI